MATSTRNDELQRRKAGRPIKVQLSFAGDLCSALEYVAEAALTMRWPSTHYRDDPVRFAHEILGVEPWWRQVEILEAIRDHPRVAVRSGHKIGKSNAIGIAAFWFYCSYEDARAIMTSTTARQVDQILWRELSMMKARSGRCLKCKLQDPDGRRIPAPCPHSALIDGDMGSLARTGLKSVNFREITGFTAREAEAVAGISGANLLYLPDEASGIPQKIFEAMEGNRAGGARLAMFSNPTKNEGEFFDAFHSKSGLYKTITVSSEETPNAVTGENKIPGLATRAWIEEKKEEWGENSALYSVRVKGLHPLSEDGKIFSVHAIASAERAWADADDAGRLFLGVDVAGPAGKGDEIIMAPRRAKKVLRLHRFQGLDAQGHLIQILALLGQYRRPNEIKPVVVIDAEGEYGSKVANVCRAYVESNQDAFELVCVYASSKAQREPLVYERIREELAASLARFLLDGGAIPEDAKLAAELHIWEWRTQLSGRVKLWPPKEEVRKSGMLNRSPDRYDAVALSVWEPIRLAEAQQAQPVQKSAEDLRAPVIDPYAGADAWRQE